MGLVEEISRDNTALGRLAQQSSTLEPMRSRRKRPILDAVRTNASNVFAGLQKALQNSCQSVHTASLYISSVGQQCQNHNHALKGSGGSEAYRIVLQHTSLTGHTLPWLCKETEIRLSDLQIETSGTKTTKFIAKSRVRFVDPASVPLTTTATCLSNSPQPSAVIPDIKDLCGSILGFQSRECGVCLGYLADTPKSVRLGLFRPQAPIIDSDSFSMLSLGDMLKEKHGVRSLSVASRRRLAASLALGLLRLHNTPWLSKQWGHKEITFFSNSGRILTEHAFLTTSVTSQGAPCDPIAYFTPSAAITNESLFVLGIILIELCLHQAFENLLSPAELNPDGTKHAASEYLAALRLLDKVDEEASWRYGDAIRHCINCPFNQGAASLDNKVFREAVYDNVVAVLEEEASQFSRP
jgi:hypothetical protein